MSRMQSDTVRSHPRKHRQTRKNAKVKQEYIPESMPPSDSSQPLYGQSALFLSGSPIMLPPEVFNQAVKYGHEQAFREAKAINDQTHAGEIDDVIRDSTTMYMVGGFLALIFVVLVTAHS